MSDDDVSWSSALSGFLLPMGFIGFIAGYSLGWIPHFYQIFGFDLPTGLGFIVELFTIVLILMRFATTNVITSDVIRSWIAGAIIGVIFGVLLWLAVAQTTNTAIIANVQHHVQLISLILSSIALVIILPHLLKRGWDA